MLGLLAGTSRRVQRVFFGWWIVAAGFVIQMMNSGLLSHGFTIYFVPLQREFGWSRVLLASGYALSHIESALIGPVEGWVADKFGPRRIVLIGVLFLGGGFILLSRVHSIAAFFAAFVLMSIGSSLAGFLPLSVAIINWFAKKRARAIGIAMAGQGVGGLIAPILAWSLNTYGWRSTALVSGLLIWLVGIPMALLLRHKPEQYGCLPDGEMMARPSVSQQGEGHTAARAPAAQYPSDGSFSPKEALLTPAFWYISLGHASAILVVSAVSLHQVPHMVQQLNMSLEAAGGIVAFLMGMSVVGRVFGGVLADRMDKRVLLVACMLAHAAGLLFLAYATNVMHLLLFATLHGLAWGARAPVQQAIRADYFGRNSFGTIMGISSVLVTVSSVTAPIFAGWLADLRGNYRLAFTILAVLTGFGSLFFLFARKPVPRPAVSRQEVATG